LPPTFIPAPTSKDTSILVTSKHNKHLPKIIPSDDPDHVLVREDNNNATNKKDKKEIPIVKKIVTEIKKVKRIAIAIIIIKMASLNTS
jgi:hypothetical protein